MTMVNGEEPTSKGFATIVAKPPLPLYSSRRCQGRVVFSGIRIAGKSPRLSLTIDASVRSI